MRSVIVIGGGIVGLASAWQLTRLCPGTRVTVLEKEAEVAHHQTGHNSGVLHSGIYYKPGSLKALNCRAGKVAMEEFCKREGIPFETCGKVIVATDEKEVAGLAKLYERGAANGVVCELIGPERLRELEPHVRGVKAIHVKEAGIAAYVQVCRRLAELVAETGGQVVTGARATAIRHLPNSIAVETTAGSFEADYLINCAGLQSDRVTALSGAKPPAKIIPFRGEYFELRPEASKLCRNLIYPVPDPNFPFLGVHYTRMMAGGVECGPNAVLALAREGYTWSDINLVDLVEVLTYGGFLRMMAKHWAMASYEVWRSLNKAAFTKALQRLIPEIQKNDLQPAPAGIRAQALTPEGTLVDDFLLQQSHRIVNVCNAPSPAATASLAIGKYVVETLAKQF